MVQDHSNSGTGRFENKLKAYLYRLDCPHPSEICNYQYGSRDKEYKQRIKNHLQNCSSCRQELTILKEFMEFSGKEDVKDQVKRFHGIRFKSRFLSYKFFPLLPVVQPALRGETAGPMKASFQLEGSDVGLFLEMETKAEQYNFRGQFDPPAAVERKLMDSLVEVWQKDELIAATFVDDFLTFSFVLEYLSPVAFRLTNNKGTLFSFQVDLKKGN